MDDDDRDSLHEAAHHQAMEEQQLYEATKLVCKALKDKGFPCFAEAVRLTLK